MNKKESKTFCINDSEKLDNFFSTFYLKLIFNWRTIIGKNNINKMRPLLLKNSHLVIAVPNSMVKTYVASLKYQIPQKISQIYFDSPIKTVSFVVVSRLFPRKLKRKPNKQPTKIILNPKKVEQLKQTFLKQGFDEELAEKFAEIGAIFELKNN